MVIKFKQLLLKNFKSHRDLTVEFGDTTQITGDNAMGKSSIAEAITWLLYGVDMVGSKMDPAPITYDHDITAVTLLLEVDSKQVLLGRELKNGKAKYYVNEVPSKATEFNELLDSMFNKDLFLSLFNPNYFFTLHWETQRSMLLQYVTPPVRKDVLKELEEVQAEALEMALKKHNISDLEKVHKNNKSKADKDHIRAQATAETLKKQLEEKQVNSDVETLKAEYDALVKQRNEIEKVTDKAAADNGMINIINSKIKLLIEQRDKMKERFAELKQESNQHDCPTCGRELDGEALEHAKTISEKRISKFKKEFNAVVDQRKKLEEKLSQLEYIDISKQLENARLLQEKIMPIDMELRKHKEIELLKNEFAEAEKREKETLESRNNSIFILDSIKAFHAKEAELQASKAQELFETLSIKLFEQQKNGDFKNTFEIEMDGKPYRKLSLSEGIRAGLELRNVLSKQSDVITPVFIDNSESITRFNKPIGQLIKSQVVAGQELKIEGMNVNE